jgi:hypothetical protein
MLDRIDALGADIDALTAQLQVIAPFATQLTQIDEIPASGSSAPKSLSPNS